MLYQWTCCQDLSIYYQLKSGVRYIDLRYGPGSDKPDDIHILHLVAKSITWEEGLTQVSEFVKENPEELVFIKIQREKDCSKAQNAYIYNSIKRHLVFDRIVKRCESTEFTEISPDAWFSFKQSTYGDVRGKGKNFLVFLEPRMFIDADFQNEFFSRFEYVDGWMDQSSAKPLQDRLSQNISEYQDFDKEFYVAQVVLTPDWSACRAIGYILGCGTGSVSKHMGFLLKDDALRYFTKNMIKTYKCGTFMFDFVNWIPDLLKFILTSNFEKSLQVKYAVLGNNHLDPAELQNQVTYSKNLEPYFRNLEGYGSKVGNVLYLPNFLVDMGFVRSGSPQKSQAGEIYQQNKLTREKYLVQNPESRFLVVGYSWGNEPGINFEVFDVATERVLIGYSSTKSCLKAGQPKVFIDQFDCTTLLLDRLNTDPAQELNAEFAVNQFHQSSDTGGKPMGYGAEVRVVKEVGDGILIRKLKPDESINKHL